jgi:Fic family protein
MLMKKKKAWAPKFTITPAITRGLMKIEAAKAVVEHTHLPLTVREELRRRAMIRSTHFSTRIEGNRLTLAEAEAVIEGTKTQFPGRERDVREVNCYWNALLRVEEWAAKRLPLTEERIKKLHALIEKGPRARPTPYRTGQNVIRDSSSGAIVYMPPEAKDVPSLMLALVEWYKITEYDEIPVPLTAALVHYQFVTIHPYYDGNGRTARLLATFILHRGGYGLNGFFSLEEYHDRNISDYYNALSVHPHHNYYEGRSNTDLTPWVEYFIELLSSVFNVAREEAVSNSDKDLSQEPAALRRLDPRARRVLGLFLKKERIISADVAGILGISKRMARVLLKRWTEDGWLKVADPSRKGRSYILSAIYRQFIGNI